MWRPDNWDAKEIAKSVRVGFGESLFIACVEAGADAMLEELKDKGALMTPEQMKLLAPDRQYPFGWLVFIPDKEMRNDRTRKGSEDSRRGCKATKSVLLKD